MDGRQRLLDLLGGEGVFLSIEEIAHSIGLDTNTSRSLLEEMSADGVRLVEVPGRGFGIGAVSDILFEQEVRRFLRTRNLGGEIIFRHEVTSTNSLAVALAENGKPHGTVILADRQTDGRGRMGRTWVSPAGVNLYLSVILRPDLPPTAATEVPIVMAVAVARALERQTPPLRMNIKWPNDLQYDGRKVGGILCEMRASANRIQFLVAGIGINVNATEFTAEISDRATSMRLASGESYLRPLLAADLLEEIESAWDSWTIHESLDPFREYWIERSILEGRQITVTTQTDSVEGVAEGLAASGALLLRMPDGAVREIYAGDAHIGPVT